MLSSLTHKLPLSLKLTLFFLGIIASITSTLYYLHKNISDTLFNQYAISIDLKTIIPTLPPLPFAIILSVLLLLFILISIDIISFIKTINAEIKNSLDDRKLNKNFDHFFTSYSFFTITKNIKSIFNLYKSFDNMKTARIVLEVSTIKQLMNNVSEGLILVNKNSIVTHLNHVSEHDLGLIPGECIGQAISRKISNEILLESLEKAFDFDTKFVDLDLEEDNLTASIYPLKDKFGDTIRALIMLKLKPEEPIKKQKK